MNKHMNTHIQTGGALIIVIIMIIVIILLIIIMITMIILLDYTLFVDPEMIAILIYFYLN